MDKMNVYKQLATPPKDALKTIGGGRLKNMTDIKPQWRIEKMTEIFGACGVGWYPEITKQWTEEGCDGQKLSFCNINLYIKVDGEWSKPIPGTGGNMLTTKEAKGLYSSDEAHKMAFTDALSVAMKLLGMAADIYRGTALDSKYAQQEDTTEKPAQKIDKSVHDKTTVLGDCIKLIKNSGFDEPTTATLRKKYAEVKTLEQAESFKAEVEKLISVKRIMVDDLSDAVNFDDDIPFENKELF